ncbi:bifunctional folylpolyglutamate synthase/dihydrofolate synthase [Oleidesulfovibrio sp.]|uniref:bifunctional folylpolyglutamate synthase/dihydrofolate synthase n=1 Tax=Oleidesulfovibrio sp. TaxID=2909707 RepID=UPI003A83999B
MSESTIDTDTTTEEGHFSSYAEVMAYLGKLGLFHMELDLGRIRTVLDELELTRPEYPVVQVVGTNGKGSTATFIASIATGSGLNTGLFTSPHFVTPRERVLVDGEMLPEEDWLLLANDIMAAGGETLTYFEFITVLAALAFADYEVELAVFEAGLGGTYDATTAIAADTVVFTSIDMDHENILGDTIEKIAADKAGAIRKHVPVVTTAQQAAVRTILDEACAAQSTRAFTAEDLVTLPEEAVPALHGPHQRRNATLALAALQTIMDEKAIPRPTLIPWTDVVTLGIADAWIAGRMQLIEKTENHPALILDGGHNLHGLTTLKEALVASGTRPAAIVFAAMKDKSLNGVGKLLAEMTDGPILLPALTGNERAALPAELAVLLKPDFADAAMLRPCASVQDALQQAQQIEPQGDDSPPVLMCGSLFLLAEFFTLHPEYLKK